MLTLFSWKPYAIYHRYWKGQLCNDLLNKSSTRLVWDQTRLKRTRDLPRLAWGLVMTLRRVMALFWLVQLYRKCHSYTGQPVDNVLYYRYYQGLLYQLQDPICLRKEGMLWLRVDQRERTLYWVTQENSMKFLVQTCLLYIC